MTNGRRVLRGGLILTAGNAAGALLSFARNVFIARLISVEDFGIAALLALSMSFVEIVSNLAIDRILVQARDGDSERMQSTGQAFQAVRGLGNAVVLFLAATYIAELFNVAHATWAFQVLAIVPAIRGFIHLDAVRYQREMKFGASTWMEVVPQVAALSVAIPLGNWLGDYRVMLWVIVLQAVLQVATSHVLATRKYAWTWSREILKRMIAFGWPLMVNGLLMFIIFQGDKAIVGAAFTMTELGWYSAAFMLTFAPSLIVTKVLQSLFLPYLSERREDVRAFQFGSAVVAQVCLICGVVYGVLFILAGGAMVTLLYGDRYSGGLLVISVLSAMQAVRIAKSGPTVCALALGETKSPMYSSLARACALPICIGVVSQGGNVFHVATIGLLTEVAGFIVAVRLVAGRSVNGISLARDACTSMMIIAMIYFAQDYAFSGLAPTAQLALAGLTTSLAALTSVLCFPMLQSYVASAIASLCRR